MIDAQLPTRTDSELLRRYRAACFRFGRDCKSRRVAKLGARRISAALRGLRPDKSY